jgi:dTDP-4-dehydrorhamnose 3,5-epimerase-like enzyme
MEQQPVLIQYITNLGDLRGWTFRIPEEALAFLGEIHEMHLASIIPGCIRGNHVHAGRKEVLFLQFEAECQFAWALRDSDQVHIETLSNHGGIMIQILPEIVHSIKNIGSKPVILLACSDGTFDPEYKDTERRVILT